MICIVPAGVIRPLVLTALGCATVLTIAACLTGSSDTAASSSSAVATDTAPDVVTPVIASTVDDPIPVVGSDGRTHLAYELVLTNVTPDAVAIRSLAVSSSDQQLLTALARRSPRSRGGGVAGRASISTVASMPD